MMSTLASATCAVIVIALLGLEKNRDVRVSWTSWIPTIWMLLAASRNVSEWTRPPVDRAVNAYAEGSALDRAVLGTLMALGVVVLLQRRQQLRRFARGNLPLLAYFIYCGTSVLWSDYPDISFKRWIRACGDLVMVLVILSDPQWLAALKRMLSRVGFVLLPASVLCIRYYPTYGRAYLTDGSASWSGVATNKNELGLICLIFGLASVWRILEELSAPIGQRASRVVFAHGCILGVAIYLLHLANSQTSTACLGLGCGTLIMASVPKWKSNRALIHMGVALILSVAFCVLFLNIGGELLGVLGRDASLTGRTDLWALVLRMVQNPVLGSGFESFWLGDHLKRVNEVFVSHTNQAHNGYLEVYLNLGWVGIALLIAVIVRGYLKAVSALPSRAGNLLLSYFVIALCYNCTEGAFKMMNPVWIVFLMATVSLSREAVRECQPDVPFVRRQGHSFGAFRQPGFRPL